MNKDHIKQGRFDPKTGEIDLQEWFEKYLMALYGGSVTKDTVQYREMRQVWFAVAQLTLHYTLDLTELTEDVAEMRLSALCQHIEDNIEGIKDEIIKAAGFENHPMHGKPTGPKVKPKN